MSVREEPKFFSVAEIGRILGISSSKTYELMASDNCPFNVVKIGKRICVPANSFYKWYVEGYKCYKMGMLVIDNCNSRSYFFSRAKE